MAGHIKKRKRSNGSTTYQARIPSPANRRKDLVTGASFAVRVRSHVATNSRNGVAAARGSINKTRERYGSVTCTHLLPEFSSTPLGRLSRAEINCARTRRRDCGWRRLPGGT
jgi:hypothetical protein